MEDNRTIACPHVIRGAMPQMLVIEEGVLIVASCFNCADHAQATLQPENFHAVCKHSHPGLPMWGCEGKFSEDGIYQLLEGKYRKQPDFPQEPNA
jgi:hypothetical protein